MNEKIAAELEKIQADKGGLLRPVDVLEFATNNEGTAIRAWMDEKGAFNPDVALEKYGLSLARQLIRSVKVTIISRENVPIRVRAMTSLASDRVHGGGYRSTVTVMQSPTMRDQLLQTAMAELHSLRKKYQSLEELAGVWAAMEEVAAA